MAKQKQKILFFFLFIFSVYCALTIGQTWDEGADLIKGKITLNYLFSLGEIDNKTLYRENYSPIYWSLLYFLTKIFPSQYQIEVSHLINSFLSLGTIFAIRKLSKELFNYKVGNLVFLILFFYPIFFGHMAINYKDTVLAFSHVWITYLMLRYLKKHNTKENTNRYVIFIGILAAISTGIQLVFLGSLIPIFLFILFEIFFFKKFTNKNFNKRIFFYDLVKCFIVFYSLLILFWIDVYPNIFLLPFNIFMETLSPDYWTGWPYNIINGDYYLSKEVPKFYLLINFIYKSPEYVLFTYLSFIILIFTSKKFFKKRFKFFSYKLFFIISILIFPNLVLIFIPYPVYDGMRLFLWSLPYFCIIPALTIYYLIENFNFIKPKLTLSFLITFIIYFMFNFLSITPYHYTYLNIFNGKIENRYQKFENDYWGSTIKELVKNTKFNKNETITIATCGVSKAISKKYFKKKGYYNLKFVSHKNADYIIMTNRAILKDEKIKDDYKLTNCFDRFKGDDVFKVERNGLLLSVIRKI